jgi:hypothetical protein
MGLLAIQERATQLQLLGGEKACTHHLVCYLQIVLDYLQMIMNMCMYSRG